MRCERCVLLILVGVLDHDICCQVPVVGGEDAVCQRGVSTIFTDIPDSYWGNSLRDGDPLAESFELSVIKLREQRDTARPCLGESHDISVKINALQILVRNLNLKASASES